MVILTKKKGLAMKILSASGESKIFVPCRHCKSKDTYCFNAERVTFFEEGSTEGEKGKIAGFKCNSCFKDFNVRIELSYL